MPKLIDLTGQRFGRLVVVERHGITPYKHLLWFCRCDCGKTKTTTATCLRKGDTKSCGCLYDERRLTNGHPNRRKYSGVTRLYTKYWASAKHKNRTFALSIEQFINLTSSDCHYCGQPPSHTSLSQKARVPYVCNGIDRVDSSGGYEPKNCVPCCRVCNRAKMDMPYDDFMAWISRIIKFRDGERILQPREVDVKSIIGDFSVDHKNEVVQ